MKIGILGGTFDRIHEGHLTLARAAREQFSLGKILFIPAFIPPHKAARRDLTPAPYRYRMVELAIKGEPAFEISDVELNRPDVSYTVDTLRALKMKYPQAGLFLIVGSDTLAEIPHWREPEEIARLATILVARRFSPHPVPLPLRGRGEAARRASLARGRGEGTDVHWIEMPGCPISSSAIREAIRQGRPLEKGVLPQDVEDYIRKMKLYEKEPWTLS